MNAEATWIERTTKRIESLAGLTKAIVGLITALIALLGAFALGGSGKPNGASEPKAVPSDVVSAYLRAVAAYNRADADTYRRAYTDPLDCYYDRVAPPSSTPTQRIGGHLAVNASDLELLRLRQDEVVFCDRGRYQKDKTLADHIKTIVMRKQSEGWKIAIEVGRSNHGCYPRSMPMCP